MTVLLPLLTEAEKRSLRGLLSLCRIKGRFTLHSGLKSNWICDLSHITTDFTWIVQKLQADAPAIAGIELGGALLVASYPPSTRPKLIIRKDGTLAGETQCVLPGTIVDIIDDVCTTGASFLMAAEVLLKEGLTPGRFYCVLNRGDFPAVSLMTAKEMGWES